MLATAQAKKVAKMKLTDITIRNLPLPKQGQQVYWDKGLGVRVSQGGTKSFVVKQSGKWLTLGKYPAMSLKMAREGHLRLKVSDAPQTLISSLSEARRAYLSECEQKNSPATVKQYRHFLTQVDRKKLVDVVRTDVDLGSPHAVMAWRVFFNWCIRNELTTRNPFSYVPVRWTSRSRVLSDDEVEKLYSYEYPPYSDYIKISILTGQRIGQWKHYQVEGDTLVFPATNMKNRQEHVIPLTEWSSNIIKRLAPFNGWSKAKVRIDAHTGVTNWVHHDFRRYLSTTMASLSIPLHVTECILSHKGQVSGVAAVYNRYNFLKEMKEALEKYEAHLHTLLVPGHN